MSIIHVMNTHVICETEFVEGLFPSLLSSVTGRGAGGSQVAGAISGPAPTC